MEYFDKDLKKVISKQSTSFDIELENNTVEKSTKLIKKVKTELKSKEVIKVVEKTSTKDRLIFFAFGIIVGILILGLYFYVIKYKTKSKSNDTALLKKINKAKTKDELLKILAVYIRIDSTLDELIFKLEENSDIKLIKKDIVKRIKKINL